MEDSKIRRINELAKKAKTEGLTPEEAAEQKQLRQEYVAAFRASLKGELDRTVVVDADGRRHPIKKPLS